MGTQSHRNKSESSNRSRCYEENGVKKSGNFGLEGHKLENIAHEERVSFCAVAGATVLPASLSTLYESAIVFGRAAVVTDPTEKQRGLELLAIRFCGAVTPEAEKVIADSGSRTAVVRIRIEQIAGKAHRIDGTGYSV
jgi:nitroimidazol reductase NimA-like FMN-containing flavoprotein (pyridoxamine 5'-phosphate oxidase superfamily)